MQKISRAIDSVIKQSYSNWELIIIDDGSSDGTRDVISSYKDDNRIKYYFKTNGGVSKAREFGLKKTEGKYITFLDSDDFFYPNRLKRMYSYLCKKENVDLVYTSFTVQGEEFHKYSDINDNYNTILDSRSFVDDILFSQKMTCLWRGLFRSSLVKNIHFRNLDYAEDYFFLLDYAMICRSVAKLNNDEYCYVTGVNGSLTSNSSQHDNLSFFVSIPMFLSHYLIDNGFCGKKYEKKLFTEYIQAIKRIIRFGNVKNLLKAKKEWKDNLETDYFSNKFRFSILLRFFFRLILL